MENLMCELNDQEGVLSLIMCEQTKYTNSSYTVGVFEVLQSLRKDKFLCDINIETNVNTIIAAHKIVLISASPYFHKMFTNFSNINLNHIIISELDSTIIEILINYIYSGEIIVSKDNVKVLLAAANLLQLDYVKNICAEFLQTQLDPSNCIGIKAFADLYNCMELSTSCQTFIKNRFLEVTDKDEFLSLNSVDVINLISCNNIFVPQEENVFECVMNWVKHDLNSRKDFLPELMEHVRLPLISKHYFVNKVIDEPLLKCSPKCQFFINEASTFHLIKQVQPFKVLETIQCKPRKSIGFEKVFLLYSLQEKVGGLTYWDQTNLMSAPTTTNCYITGCLTVINDQFVLAMGGVNLRSSFQCVEMLDVTSPSPCWIPMMSMLVSRQDFGVGTLDNCVYAIGSHDADNNRLKSAEVFDTNTTEWKMVRSMTTERSSHSVGVLNNLLYVVGGYDGQISLNSVECYDPSMDTWTSVAEMSECRQWCGVGVLNGVLYAIGGFDFSKTESLKSVEAYTPSTGVWTYIADMHLSRNYFGVVVLDGLLHAVGGRNNEDVWNSIEVYNPKTNTWIFNPTFSIKYVGIIRDGFVVNRPPNLPPTIG